MKQLPNSTRDRILWELANQGGKMKRSELRRRLRITLAELEPKLQDLEKEGKIGIFELKEKRSNQMIILK